MFLRLKTSELVGGGAAESAPPQSSEFLKAQVR